MRKVRVQVQGPLIENTIRSLLPTSKVCGQRPFYSDRSVVPKPEWALDRGGLFKALAVGPQP